MAMVPHERSLVEKNKNQPFVLLGIDVDPNLDDGKKAVKDKKINWRSWHDKQGKICSTYGVTGIPRLVIIDHTGTVRKIMGRPQKGELEKLVGDLIKKVPKAKAEKEDKEEADTE